jgi:HD-like signal output (HDOD) protein
LRALNQPESKASAPNPLFDFVTGLARELSVGRVELPSFPEAAARIQQALSDDSVTAERIARIAGSDAGLTVRLLTMANSTLLHRGGAQVSDLKVAITRIGHENIRTAALAYATAQLRLAPDLAHIKTQLDGCWQEGVRVAALAHAIAKESRRVRSDEAMLAGLLHNIGKIYILARTPTTAAAALNYDDKALRNWHPGIGQALIENWKLPEQVALAVGGQMQYERTAGRPADLRDLLSVAVSVAARMAAGVGDEAALAAMPAAVALGLTDSSLVRIMLESQTEVTMLHSALG